MTDKNNNIFPIVVAFFLILLVGFFTFLKLDTPKKEEKIKTAPETGLSDEFKKTKQLDSVNLAKKISQKEKVVIIDARDEEDYRKDHILNSQNIPIASLGIDMMSYEKEAPYVIMDYDGSAPSLMLIDSIMKELGFSNVMYLQGGFSQWKKDFYPTVSEGDPNSFTDQSKVTYISSDELKNMMEKSADLIIIDVRKPNQFQQGHIKGAINIFLDELEKKRGEIPLGKKIALYDNDGLWAFKASVRLFDMSFFDTLSLSDGLDEWKNKGYEIKTTD